MGHDNVGFELVGSNEGLRNGVDTDEDKSLLTASEVVLTNVANEVPKALAKPEPYSLNVMLKRSVKDGLQLSTSLLKLPSQKIDTDGKVVGQWKATRFDGGLHGRELPSDADDTVIAYGNIQLMSNMRHVVSGKLLTSRDEPETPTE